MLFRTSYLHACICMIILSMTLSVDGDVNTDSGCPMFFKRIINGNDGFCYRAFDLPLLSWWDAMAYCSIYGNGAGTLARIDNNIKQVNMEEFLGPSKTAKTYWLGATDVIAEGTWIWPKMDKLVDFSKWAVGQPSGGRGENCLALWYGPYWHDAPCEWSLGFVCQVPRR